MLELNIAIHFSRLWLQSAHVMQDSYQSAVQGGHRSQLLNRAVAIMHKLQYYSILA